MMYEALMEKIREKKRLKTATQHFTEKMAPATEASYYDALNCMIERHRGPNQDNFFY